MLNSPVRGNSNAREHLQSGFCIFNAVAVAARHLLNEGAVSLILVVDLDIHQRDGTATACFTAQLFILP
ncbi:MAG: hypothetical protein EA428_01575 [Spirochaetaceae bacterium]|nr:MAG: hypothetical protein EA428_01575 [Spirochaetaceae bacterium]